MCDPASSTLSLFSFFFFKKINHWYRPQFFREMRQKSKKVGRQLSKADNSEANATNRVPTVQIVTSQKGQQPQNSPLGKNGRKIDLIKIFFFYIFFFNFPKLTEQSIFL